MFLVEVSRACVHWWHKRRNWVGDLLFALYGGGGGDDGDMTHEEALLRFPFFLAESNRDVLDEKLNGYSLPNIDPVTTKAVQSFCNVNCYTR